MKRSILLDSNAVNYMMTPDNSLPVFAYTAEYEGKENEKDVHLSQLIEELEELKDLEDVRPAL